MQEKRDFSVCILYKNTVEINEGKEKLLIFGTYKPSNINNGSFLNELAW